jgi:PAS domain S-box-containing protein
MEKGRSEKARDAPPLASAHWAELIHYLHGPVYICDADGYITHFNEAAVALWGRRPEIGRDRWCGALRRYQVDGQELPPDQSPMAFAIRARQAIHDAEIIIEKSDGSRRQVRLNPNPIIDASGELLGAVNQMLDATAYKESDHARARLAAIIQYSDDAIISKDINGIITSWNQGAERLFGYEAAEVIGRPITILIPPDRLDEEPAVLARIRRGESVDHFETIRRRKDGSPVEISLTISPIRGSNGVIIGASKVARDIGDRKRAERSLAEADRRKDEFIATLAHELRNPLAPLKTSLHLIRMTGYSGHVPRSTLEMMERQVNHLGRLVEDLLDLSRLTQGTIQLKKEKLGLSDVVSDAMEATSPLIESKNHRLELALTPDLWVLGDRTRLVQILVNLLNNAAKFTRPRGLIRLVVERDGKQARIRCADNGMGIVPEMQEAVFGMFIRTAEGSDAGREGGMGIGLSVVKHLVALHGGTIKLRSEGADKGTEFTVCLPLTQNAPEQGESTAPLLPHPAHAARRILVVDDNVDAAESLAALFGALGHEVTTAKSGAEGLAKARQRPPDVVLLDIGLPDQSGHQIAAQMRQEPWGKTVLLVALTGWGEDRDRKLSMASGFDHHFVKPVDLDALETLMTRALVRH